MSMFIFIAIIQKRENILYVITSLLQFQNIHTLYTISHITNNFWAQEWHQNIFWEIQEVGPLKFKKSRMFRAPQH
jgi:hypothetical protein